MGRIGMGRPVPPTTDTTPARVCRRRATIPRRARGVRQAARESPYRPPPARAAAEPTAAVPRGAATPRRRRRGPRPERSPPPVPGRGAPSSTRRPPRTLRPAPTRSTPARPGRTATSRRTVRWEPAGAPDDTAQRKRPDVSWPFTAATATAASIEGGTVSASPPAACQSSSRRRVVSSGAGRQGTWTRPSASQNGAASLPASAGQASTVPGRQAGLLQSRRVDHQRFVFDGGVTGHALQRLAQARRPSACGTRRARGSGHLLPLPFFPPFQGQRPQHVPRERAEVLRDGPVRLGVRRRQSADPAVVQRQHSGGQPPAALEGERRQRQARHRRFQPRPEPGRRGIGDIDDLVAPQPRIAQAAALRHRQIDAQHTVFLRGRGKVIHPEAVHLDRVETGAGGEPQRQ